MTETDAENYHCEIGVTAGDGADHSPDSILKFIHRGGENAEHFNAVLLVPTGIGAEIGGHAGDATPVARLLAESCDQLITHPNVVNASDLNEMPDGTLYVEGSVITRLLMGTAGLRPVRANRVLVVIDAHEDSLFSDAAVNAVSAARAAYGLDCPRVVHLDPPVKLRALYSASGRATGEVTNLDYLWEVLEEYRHEFDAIAISTVIEVPEAYHHGYFVSAGGMVNPWGRGRGVADSRHVEPLQRALGPFAHVRITRDRECRPRRRRSAHGRRGHFRDLFPVCPEGAPAKPPYRHR